MASTDHLEQLLADAPDTALNYGGCVLGRLIKHPGLTESERKLASEAWHTLLQAQVAAMKRLNPELFKDEKPDGSTADKLHS